MPTSKSLVRLAVVLAVAASLASPTVARAQTVMVYDEGQAPSAQDVADILSRGASENMKMRSLHKGATPFALLEQTPTRQVSEASAVSVAVPFAFGSSALTVKARQQLDVIADGIRLTEGTVKVVVEGHTDAKGAVSYNEGLSYRRASAVRRYLVEEKKLAAALLGVEGKGPHKLLNKSNPFDGANRRVQFRAGG